MSKSPKTGSGHALEALGDPSLSPRALLPTQESHRRLKPLHLGVLSAAVVVWAGVVFPGAALTLDGALMSFGAVVCAVLLVFPVAERGARYGLGLVPMTRALWGPRGALLFDLLRLIVAVVFGSLWLQSLGKWFGSWLLVFFEVPQWQSFTAGTSQGWFAAGVMGVCAWVAASIGRQRALGVARAGVIALGVVAISGAILVVLGGQRSHGFVDEGGVDLRAAPESLLGSVENIVALVLLGAVAMSDWWRLARGSKSAVPLWQQPWMKYILYLVAGMVALAVVVGAQGLWARASWVVRGRVDWHPIADATGFFGLAGGALGAVWSLGLWVLCAPLVLFYGPSLALVDLCRARLRTRHALWVCALAFTLCAGFVPMAVWLRIAPFIVGAWCVACALISAHMLYPKTRKLQLEELYALKSSYGPLWGVSPAGVVSLLLGLVPPMFIHANASWLWGVVLAVVTYGFLKPLERYGFERLAVRRRRAAPSEVTSVESQGHLAPIPRSDDSDATEIWQK